MWCAGILDNTLPYILIILKKKKCMLWIDIYKHFCFHWSLCLLLAKVRVSDNILLKFWLNFEYCEINILKTGTFVMYYNVWGFWGSWASYPSQLFIFISYLLPQVCLSVIHNDFDLSWDSDMKIFTLHSIWSHALFLQAASHVKVVFVLVEILICELHYKL